METYLYLLSLTILSAVGFVMFAFYVLWIFHSLEWERYPHAAIKIIILILLIPLLQILIKNL